MYSNQSSNTNSAYNIINNNNNNSNSMNVSAIAPNNTSIISS